MECAPLHRRFLNLHTLLLLLFHVMKLISNSTDLLLPLPAVASPEPRLLYAYGNAGGSRLGNYTMATSDNCKFSCLLRAESVNRKCDHPQFQRVRRGSGFPYETSVSPYSYVADQMCSIYLLRILRGGRWSMTSLGLRELLAHE